MNPPLHIKKGRNDGITNELRDKVLLYNSRLKLFPGKLKSRWYGPFTVKSSSKTRVVVLMDDESREFTVNIQRVKHYQENGNEMINEEDKTFDDEVT